jgi:hypothetical protein
MSSGFNAPTPIADGALFYLTDSGGTRQLYHLEEVSFTDEGSVEVVNGPAGTIGTRRKAGGFKVNLKSNRAVGVAEEASWERLRNRDERVTFAAQILGGSRLEFPDYRVATVNTSIGADGAVTNDVTLVGTTQDTVEV